MCAYSKGVCLHLHSDITESRSSQQPSHLIYPPSSSSSSFSSLSHPPLCLSLSLSLSDPKHTCRSSLTLVRVRRQPILPLPSDRSELGGAERRKWWENGEYDRKRKGIRCRDQMKETAEERKEKGRRGFKSLRTKDSERIERKRERERVC